MGTRAISIDQEMTTIDKRHRATSIIIAIVAMTFMVSSSLGIMAAQYRAPSQPIEILTTPKTSDYPLTDQVIVWTRWNGSDPGYPYPNEGQDPSLGVDFFGSKTVYAWDVTSHYTLSNLSDTNYWHSDYNIWQNMLSLSGTTAFANAAKTDSRLRGLLWDDFPVGLESPANVSAIYTALHHEDANLSQGPLELYLVVYNNNYFLHQAYDWSDIAGYFDGIEFWYAPSSYGTLWDELNGYRDSFLELHSWLPTKGYRFGIYLHYYNRHDRPFAATYCQLTEASKLIKQGYASGFSILEAFWIKNNRETSYLVKNYLYNEFLGYYASTLNIQTGIVSSSKDSAPIAPIVRYVGNETTSGGMTLYSDHLQQITVTHPSWTDPNVQDLRTGEFEELVLGGGSFMFWASPQAKYRIYNHTYAAQSLTGSTFINSPTTWENKSITVTGKIFVNSTLTVKNSIVRFSDYHHQKTSANATIPHYGISLNESGEISLDNSTFEPVNRMFPYYFNLTNQFGTIGTRVFASHNSTIACYAGLLKAYGVFRVLDTTIYRPEGDGGNYHGLQVYMSYMSFPLREIVMKRNTIDLPLDTGAVLLCAPIQAAVADIEDMLIIGGNRTLFSIPVTNANFVYQNITISPILPYWTGSLGGWVDYYPGDTAGSHYFNLTNDFILKGEGITSFAGVLKDKNAATIGSYSTVNGTICASVVYASQTGTTITYVHPYPWTFMVTTGMVPGHSYVIRSDGWHDEYDSMLLSPHTMSFNNSVFQIHAGGNLVTKLVDTTMGLPLNVNSYVGQAGWMTTANLSYWHPRNYTYESTEILVSCTLGFTTVFPTLWNPSGNHVANWVASSSNANSAVTFSLSGLEYGRVWYNVYVDGDRIDQLKATETGIVSFSYSGPWSQHTFKVDLYDPWGPLYDMGPWMLTIGFVVGMSAIVVTAVLSRVGRGRG